MDTSKLELVDEAYENKMAAFELDCNDGKGEPIACHHVGEFYSVVKDEHERAAKVYENNCSKNGYGPSCFNLGRFYLGGRGVPQSDEAATKLMSKACEQKHLQGCYFTALMDYSIAKDINIAPPDVSSGAPSKPSTAVKLSKAEKDVSLKKAITLFDWACKEGEIESCYFLAGHYIAPESKERDPPAAVKYLEKACSSNHAPSCYNLAVMYRKGDTGIQPDIERFEQFKAKTNSLVAQFGGIKGTKAG